jgi:hypothetical protein
LHPEPTGARVTWLSGSEVLSEIEQRIDKAKLEKEMQWE